MKMKELRHKFKTFLYSELLKWLISTVYIFLSSSAFFNGEYSISVAFLVILFYHLNSWTLERILREYHSHLLHFHNCEGYALNQIGYTYDKRDEKIQHAVIVGEDHTSRKWCASGNFLPQNPNSLINKKEN